MRRLPAPLSLPRPLISLVMLLAVGCYLAAFTPTPLGAPPFTVPTDSSTAPFAPTTLGDRINQIIEENDARAAFWGIYVQDLDTGRVLYRLNTDKTLMPASNQKLLTTAAALDALGRDYRYKTTLHLDGTLTNGLLRGDLLLEGAGDPSFGSRELTGEDPLETWARALAARGVTRIEGRIIGDDDVFDDAPYAEGWDVSLLTTASYAPASSGLSYRDNLVTLKIQAVRPGAPPNVETVPPGYLTIRNRVTTQARGRRRNVRVDRRLGTEDLLLQGTVHATYRGQLDLPVYNPTTFTLYSFKQHLEAAGITVEAALVDIDDLAEKPDYKHANALYTYASPPLGEMLRLINKESNNFYAEQVFRTFGWGGSAEGGEKRVKALLSRAGYAADGLSVRDGSGLSRKDLVSPEALGRLLGFMQKHPEHATFTASLPSGGERKTTLEGRLRDLSVQAKTGSLQYVRALSGYTTGSDGHRLVFVILANNYTARSSTITRTIDQIVTTLTM